MNKEQQADEREKGNDMTNKLLDLADRVEALHQKASVGVVLTAETISEGYYECPACQGNGELEAKDYCNFDGLAVGVQFYGIGYHFGAHEELWATLLSNLPEIVAALRAKAGE